MMPRTFTFFPLVDFFWTSTGDEGGTRKVWQHGPSRSQRLSFPSSQLELESPSSLQIHQQTHNRFHYISDKKEWKLLFRAVCLSLTSSSPKVECSWVHLHLNLLSIIALKFCFSTFPVRCLFFTGFLVSKIQNQKQSSYVLAESVGDTQSAAYIHISSLQKEKIIEDLWDEKKVSNNKSKNVFWWWFRYLLFFFDENAQQTNKNIIMFKFVLNNKQTSQSAPSTSQLKIKERGKW